MALASTFGLVKFDRYDHNCFHLVAEALKIVGAEVSAWHFCGMTMGSQYNRLQLDLRVSLI